MQIKGQVSCPPGYTMVLAYRVAIVPEPCSALLLLGGGTALLGLRRRRN